MNEAVERSCSGCGQPITSAARFCANCGTPQRPIEMLTVNAPPRDFTTPAIITMALYFVFWLPGLIANFAYYSSAEQERERLGYNPQGRSCLIQLFWVLGAIPLALICLGVLAAIISAMAH